MAGGLMVKPQARVTLTPADMNRLAAEKRGDTFKPLSKKANLARVKAEYRAERVLAAQRPTIPPSGFDDSLRFGGA